MRGDLDFRWEDREDDLPYDLGGLFPRPPPEGLPVVLGALTGPPPAGGLFPLPPPEGLPVVLGALAGRPPLLP